MPSDQIHNLSNPAGHGPARSASARSRVGGRTRERRWPVGATSWAKADRQAAAPEPVDLGAPVDLLERDEELAALQAALEAARGGHGEVVVLEGPPGAGKSRLLAAARARARAAGLRVLAARGAELEREFPFGVALQLFATHVRTATPARRERLLSGPAAYATMLFDGTAADEPLAAGERRAALIAGLCWLATNLAWEPGEEEEPVPVLVAVDDAQWSDRASLAFLIALADRVAELPIAVVVAVRSGEPDTPDDLVVRLATRTRRQVLRPAPLTTAAVGRVVAAALGSQPDPTFVRACEWATGGNPFLVKALVDSLRADEIAPTARSAPRVGRMVPEEVLASVTLRLAHLPEPAVSLARASAILGDRVALDAVAELAGLEVEAAERAADSLARAQLLQAGEPLSFCHPLIAAAVVADMGPLATGRAHRRAVDLLSARGADGRQIAGHLLATRPEHDEASVRVLRSAARSALARGESEGAVRLLRRALDEPPTEAVRGAVLLELAQAEAANGDAEAIERLDRALESISDPLQRAEALHTLSRLLSSRGAMGRAAEVAERALAEVEPEHPWHGSLLAAYLAAAVFDPGARPRATAQIEPLRRQAQTGLLPDHPALCGQLAAREASEAGSVELVRRLAQAAVRDDPLVDGFSQGHSLGLVIGALAHVDELDLADRALSDALESARDRGLLVASGVARHWRALVAYRRGRLCQAIGDGEVALEIARSGWASYLGWSSAILAHAHIELGDLDAAREVVALGETGPPRLLDRALVLEARGRLAMVTGDADRALAESQAAGEHLERYGFWHPGIFSWRRTAALAAHQTGAGQLAAHHLKIALSEARRTRVARPIGEALRVAGAIAGGEEGIALLKEAVTVLERSPAQLEYARALVELGGAMRREGERAASRSALRQGLELADRFNARPLAETALAELRASGARPRRAALTGRDALTPTERRIAELAAAGRANPQISNLLFVTTKTVEWHLNHVYRKLDISSRDQLADALSRADGPNPKGLVP